MVPNEEPLLEHTHVHALIDRLTHNSLLIDIAWSMATTRRQKARVMLLTNSRNDQNHLPILLMFCNSVSWTVVGLTTHEVVVVVVNLTGIVLSTLFMLIFIKVSVGDDKVTVARSMIDWQWWQQRDTTRCLADGTDDMTAKYIDS
jgi:uncharacterized membrane protein